jgi:hypothetical protein
MLNRHQWILAGALLASAAAHAAVEEIVVTIRTSGSAPDFGAVAVDAGVPTAPVFQTTVTLPNPRVFGVRMSCDF